MKRIWIDAGKCDGCLNCTLACMNAHRADKGSIYDLDLTDPPMKAAASYGGSRTVPTAQSSAATAMNRNAPAPA